MHRMLRLVPLIVAGRSLGTLNIASLTRNQYSEDDMQLLQDIGNQVALAVANMQAYEEIAALKARLEKENVYLQEEIRTEHNFEEIVGNSPALLTVLRQLERMRSARPAGASRHWSRRPVPPCSSEGRPGRGRSWSRGRYTDGVLASTAPSSR